MIDYSLLAAERADLRAADRATRESLFSYARFAMGEDDIRKARLLELLACGATLSTQVVNHGQVIDGQSQTQCRGGAHRSDHPAPTPPPGQRAAVAARRSSIDRPPMADTHDQQPHARVFDAA